MAEVERKLKWLHAVVMDQWKSGKAAELRLCCGNGQLKVSLSADFGPSVPSWNAATAGVPDDVSVRRNPSRLRRRLRRAAERAATEKTNSEQSVAKKAATEEVVAEKEAAEKVDAEKEAAACSEKIAAEKADVKREAAEKADAEREAAETAYDEKEAAEKSDVEKAAAKKAAAEKKLAVKGAAEASTSSCGSAGRRTTATAVNSPVGVAVGFKRPPSMKRRCDNVGKSELAGETVKCHVCVCLGRETSLVLCGSRCPSCGITVTA